MHVILWFFDKYCQFFCSSNFFKKWPKLTKMTIFWHIKFRILDFWNRKLLIIEKWLILNLLISLSSTKSIFIIFIYFTDFFVKNQKYLKFMIIFWEKNWKFYKYFKFLTHKSGKWKKVASIKCVEIKETYKLYCYHFFKFHRFLG